MFTFYDTKILDRRYKDVIVIISVDNLEKEFGLVSVEKDDGPMMSYFSTNL